MIDGYWRRLLEFAFRFRKVEYTYTHTIKSDGPLTTEQQAALRRAFDKMDEALKEFETIFK